MISRGKELAVKKLQFPTRRESGKTVAISPNSVRTLHCLFSDKLGKMEASEGGSDKEKFMKLIEEMEWLDQPEDQMFSSHIEMIKYKIKQNPFVPLGAIATATVLGLGIANFARNGPGAKSQLLMRWRVGLQGATIAAMAIGVFYHRMSQSKK